MLRADGFQTREGANALGDQRVRKDDRAGVAEPAVGDGSKRLAAARGPERVRGDEARELASRDGRRGARRVRKRGLRKRAAATRRRKRRRRPVCASKRAPGLPPTEQCTSVRFPAGPRRALATASIPTRVSALSLRSRPFRGTRGSAAAIAAASASASPRRRKEQYPVSGRPRSYTLRTPEERRGRRRRRRPRECDYRPRDSYDRPRDSYDRPRDSYRPRGRGRPLRRLPPPPPRSFRPSLGRGWFFCCSRRRPPPLSWRPRGTSGCSRARRPPALTRASSPRASGPPRPRTRRRSTGG